MSGLPKCSLQMYVASTNYGTGRGKETSGRCDAVSAAGAIGHNCNWRDCFSMHMPISCLHAKSMASSKDALNPPVIVAGIPL